MSLAHNGIIRGLNSIYLQAPNIPRDNKIIIRDFLLYCQFWSESMHHHHDAEEALFFPEIESITNVKGSMEKNIEQHRAFTPGFDAFYEYCKTCSPSKYDGQKLRGLVQAFADPLVKHLHEEIDTLKALDKCDSEKVRQAYRRLEKSLMATDNVRLNIDPTVILVLMP
jgi:hemerythrin-like domain-containing protein